MTDLIRISDSNEIACVAAGRVRGYLENARARNTITGYRSSFQQFTAWCEGADLFSLPAMAETVALYLSSQAVRLRPATLEHHLAAINKAHKAAGFPSPTKDNVLIAETLKGIKRTHGTAANQKTPVLVEDLRVMLRLLPDNLQGVRDRALLLIGFAGAFRRSELVALDVADLKFQAEGLLITLRRSKTDQEGAGRPVAIPDGVHTETCPVRALRSWLDSAAISDGPVFRPMRKGGSVTCIRLTGHAAPTGLAESWHHLPLRSALNHRNRSIIQCRMRSTPITPNSIQLTKYGLVNCYLVRESDSFTLVDAALANCHDAVLAAAAAAGLPISRILLTHAHVDHVGSVDALMERLPDAQLAASERSLPLLRPPPDKTLWLDEAHGQGNDKIKGGLPGIRSVPTHIVSDGEVYRSLRAIATPGHIPGHLSYLDERDGTLFAGDALTAVGRFSVCTNTPWYFPVKHFTWSPSTAVASARRLLDYPIERFACGHGKIRSGGLAELQKAVTAAASS